MSSTQVIKPRAFKDLAQTDAVKSRVAEIMGSRGPQFLAACVQLVNNSAQLQKCDPHSVLGCALTAASLDLSIDPNLGEAHVVPYGDKAQFQIGNVGYIQLAMRSGEYKTFGSTVVRDGELVSYDELSGELTVDKSRRKSEKVIGYAAKFKLLNGFERGEYWTAEEVEKHADMYSKNYRFSKGKPDKEATCLWIQKRDEMAIKTVEKSLIRHYGPKSVQLRSALKVDGGALIDADSGELTYPDAETVPSRPEFIEVPPSENEGAPAKKGPETPPEFNKYKAVKGFLKEAQIEEKKLLAFLIGLGAAEGSIETIEALPLEVIDMCYEQRESIFKRIKEVK